MKELYENNVKVEAELFYKENGVMNCCLLGEDGKLYGYNDAMHHVHPFKQKAKYQLRYEQSKIEWILENAKKEEKPRR